MKIELNRIKIRDLVDGFTDNDEEGVVGYGSKLDIRPKYQREFVYKEAQQKAVIDTVFKNYPLNVMYWVKNADGTYELLDGQQRTLSICSYFMGEFFIDLDGQLKGYDNLAADERERFLDYELMVYVCSDGTDSERIAWFKTINIAGEELKEQEILNAVYSGEWVTALKRKFSKTGCVAMKLGGDYVKGTPIRQDVLHTVLSWISDGNVERYMAEHQHDTNADREWQYFQRVVAWIKSVFTEVRREMKDVNWGVLYKKYKDGDFSSSKLEARVAALLRRRAAAEHTRLHAPHEARGIRAPARHLPRLRPPLRPGRHGGRPHHAVARRRTHRGRQLPDALPRLQPPQGRKVKVGKPGKWLTGVWSQALIPHCLSTPGRYYPHTPPAASNLQADRDPRPTTRENGHAAAPAPSTGQRAAAWPFLASVRWLRPTTCRRPCAGAG